MKNSITSGIAGGVAGALTGLVAAGAAWNYNKKKEKETMNVDSEPADFQEDATISEDFEEDQVDEEE